MLAAVMDNGNVLVHNYKWEGLKSLSHISYPVRRQKISTVNFLLTHQEEREKMNPQRQRIMLEDSDHETDPCPGHR